ncbi:MAG: fatty acid desaturase family protein [Albidovulum sp.]|nr:fatty acid desaturase family protein [Albidovulum sp.]MDE0534429.1 fatty acid desaturase family protein [Albidovulum sp.]
MSLLSLITFPMERDYALTGPERQNAIDNGLAGAEWYRTPVDRRTIKALMRRSDWPATRDISIWMGLLLATGIGIVLLWGSWWVLPFVFVYGVLYASAADSRWHECGHGTAFRTRWKNDAIYEIASFMMMRNPVVWRWGHARHHTDTIIVGRDPEIAGMRPPQLIVICLNFFGIVAVPQSLAAIAQNAAGILPPDEADLIPEIERSKAIRVARIHLAIYAATLALAIWSWSLLPLMLIGLPRAYGIWLLLLMGLPQHLGLAEDVLDHRLNSRTVLMSPVLRFIYWNMNYHIEHHMYPMVPYHALPALHEEVKHDLPAPNPSLWHAWSEIIPCVLLQLRDPHHFIRPVLPPGAGTLQPSPPY